MASAKTHTKGNTGLFSSQGSSSPRKAKSGSGSPNWRSQMGYGVGVRTPKEEIPESDSDFPPPLDEDVRGRKRRR